MRSDLLYPFDYDYLLRKRKQIRRELLGGGPWIDLRMGVLCGTTADEVLGFLELFLLNDGIRPVFHVGEFNRYYEEAIFGSPELEAFKPDIVYVHTSSVNIRNWPSSMAAEEEADGQLAAESGRYREITAALLGRFGCQVILNDFEPPALRRTGGLDFSGVGGRTRFTSRLNLEIQRLAASDRRIILHDLASAAYQAGLEQWSDPDRWFSYKMPATVAGSVLWAASLANTIRAAYGRSRKCLALDLDNTLWGGVIGDEGPDRIRIGRETGEAEAFTAFQEYCLELRSRGVLLAVCSKNDDALAREGFRHPDSILRLEHFSAFRANWEPKSENLASIAAELNLGLDALVFVDDNPAERALVRAQLPAVAVPEVGAEVSKFPAILDRGGYFELISLSAESVARAGYYSANEERSALAGTYADYGEYLQALKMEAEIAPFAGPDMERIAELTNKTNQFNLTTRRYSFAQLAEVSGSSDYVTLSGRLRDTYGDNGIVSVIIGRREGAVLHIDLWLMSCRVIKREMERAMLDALAERARMAGVEVLHGYYARTSRNGLVAEHYPELGFRQTSKSEDGSASEWQLDLTSDYAPRNRYIRRGNDV
jgi:FkbH-like protein